VWYLTCKEPLIRLPLKALVLQYKPSVTLQQLHVPFIHLKSTQFSSFTDSKSRCIVFFLVGLKMDPCFFLIAVRYVWLYILMRDCSTCLSWLSQKLKSFPVCFNWRWKFHLQLYQGVYAKSSNQSPLRITASHCTYSQDTYTVVYNLDHAFYDSLCCSPSLCCFPGQELSQGWLHVEEETIRKYNQRRSHQTEGWWNWGRVYW